MATSKRTQISTILTDVTAYYDAANHESIVALEPKEMRQNARARVMRNGLAVIGFTILEDFLRRRAREVLGHIGQAGIRFAGLPEGLRSVLTVNALGAAAFQLRVPNLASDRVGFAQRVAQQVASTVNSPFDACEVSFGFEGSNLSEGAVEAFLRSLNIEKPWETIGRVAARGGIGTLQSGARAAFQDIARRRHEAAHDPQANVQPSDLQSSYLNALGIAFGFDAVASVAALRFKLLHYDFIRGKRAVAHSDIKLFFIDHREDGRVGVKSQNAKKYYRNFSQDQEARAFSREACMRTSQVCVVRSVRQIPMNWELVALL